MSSDFVDTMIAACGTATELAELAASIKKVADFLNDDDMLKMYEVMKSKVASYAGLSDENIKFLDEVLMEHYSTEPPS